VTADREVLARMIDPSSWAVFDGYLAEMLRKYKGQDAGYDPEAFKDKRSLKLADAIIAAGFSRTPTPGAEPMNATVREAWIVEDEDGPATGICIDLAGGGQIWTGMASGNLFAKLDNDQRDLLGEGDEHIIVDARGPGDPKIIARAVGLDEAVEIARALATPFDGGVEHGVEAARARAHDLRS
jgi:hypothetical protein